MGFSEQEYWNELPFPSPGDESPIPPGYFNSLDAKITSISGPETVEEYFKNQQHKENDLVEMLYCKNGCNNGDGVLLNEQE